MKKGKLTTQEVEIWDFVAKYLVENRETPLRTELARAFQISPQLMQHRLRKIEKKGWMQLIPNKKRNIVLR